MARTPSRVPETAWLDTAFRDIQGLGGSRLAFDLAVSNKRSAESAKDGNYGWQRDLAELDQVVRPGLVHAFTQADVHSA